MNGFAWRQPWGAPFLALVAVVVSLQVVTVGNSGRHTYLIEHLGNSWGHLRELKLHRLLTSSLIQFGPGIRTDILVLVGLATFVVLRQRVSPRRAIALWFAVDVIASVSLFGGARLFASRSVAAADYTTKLDAGSSSSALAIITAGLLTIANPVKRAAAVGLLLAIQIPYYLRARNPAYIGHVIAITATVAMTALVLRRVRPASPATPRAERVPTNGQRP